MTVAHIAGVPVEETLLPVLSGASAGFLLGRAWIASRVRRRRGEPRPLDR